MVLTPIKRLLNKDKTPFDDEEEYFGDFDNIVPELSAAPASGKELLVFNTTHMGDHIIIGTDLDGIKVTNVEVQWNFSYIFVKGDIIEKDGVPKPFKSKFKMPKGAHKKGIEGHLVKKEKRFYVRVPLKEKARLDSSDPQWRENTW
jgi:HSP20 family molecular chaperone IbpA